MVRVTATYADLLIDLADELNYLATLPAAAVALELRALTDLPSPRSARTRLAAARRAAIRVVVDGSVSQVAAARGLGISESRLAHLLSIDM